MPGTVRQLVVKRGFESMVLGSLLCSSSEGELGTGVSEANLQEGGAAPGDGVVGGQGADALRIVKAEAHADQTAIVILHSRARISDHTAVALKVYMHA